MRERETHTHTHTAACKKRAQRRDLAGSNRVVSAIRQEIPADDRDHSRSATMGLRVGMEVSSEGSTSRDAK